MSSHLIVVDRMSDWRWNREGLSIQEFDTFIYADEPRRKRPVRVINLCRRFSYLNAGYYCSLLAESRNDLPMPTVADIVDLSRKNLYEFALPDLERILRGGLKRVASPPTAEATTPTSPASTSTARSVCRREAPMARSSGRYLPMMC